MHSGTERHLLLLGLVGVAGLVGLISCGAGEAARAPAFTLTAGLGDADLGLDFDDLVVGQQVTGTVNRGTAEVRIAVVTNHGGHLDGTADLDGRRGVRTPAFVPEGPVPGAALVVRPVLGQSDPLDPGLRDFEVSIDFESDVPTAGQPRDDGDNLVQRGRYGQAGQFKLQIDHGRPSCRMAGTGGEVLVAADDVVEPQQWYRLTCIRAAHAVTLVLDELGSDEPPQQWHVAQDPGDISFSGAPLSIAAKVTDAGRLDPGSVDQFHGTIDRVLVDIR